MASINNEKYGDLLYHTVEPKLPGPNIEEIEIIIKLLQKSKDLGNDKINSEQLKIAKKYILINLHKIITDIWNSELPIQLYV